MENLIAFIKELEIQISFLFFIWIVVLIVRNKALRRKNRKLEKQAKSLSEETAELKVSYNRVRTTMDSFLKELDRTRRKVEL